MLYGLDVPTDLVTTSATPRLSKIARIGPPAMIPVPAGAERSATRPAPKWPMPSWCSVRPSFSGTRTMAFLAAAVALLIASGTSRALPWPKPARPLPSPTTTSAAKPKRLPPFTVLETRLMWTSFSISSSPPSSSSRRPRRSSRRPRPPPRSPPPRPRPPPRPPRGPRACGCSAWGCSTCCSSACAGVASATAAASTVSVLASLLCCLSSCILELQSAFARRVGEGLHPAMEEEAATVEHDARHAGLLGALGERLADGSSAVLRSAGRTLDVLVQARSRGQRGAGRVINDLGVDVTAGAVDRKPRLAGSTSAERRADAAAAAVEEGEFRHGLLLLAFFAEDVLTAILDALALVRLGLAPAADFRRDLADGLLVDPADLDRVLVRSLHVNTRGQLVVHVVAVAELKAQVLSLRLGAIADAGDFEHFRKALRHARDEVLHVGAGHSPRRTVALRVGQRGHADLALGNLVLDEIVEQLHRQGALRALDGEDLALDRGRHARRHRDRLLTNAGH